MLFELATERESTDPAYDDWSTTVTSVVWQCVVLLVIQWFVAGAFGIASAFSKRTCVVSSCTLAIYKPNKVSRSLFRYCQSNLWIMKKACIYTFLLLFVCVCEVVTTLVMSIISAVTLLYCIPLTAMALHLEEKNNDMYFEGYDYDYGYLCKRLPDGGRHCWVSSEEAHNSDYTIRVSRGLLRTPLSQVSSLISQKWTIPLCYATYIFSWRSAVCW